MFIFLRMESSDEYLKGSKGLCVVIFFGVFVYFKILGYVLVGIIEGIR